MKDVLFVKNQDIEQLIVGRKNIHVLIVTKFLIINGSLKEEKGQEGGIIAMKEVIQGWVKEIEVIEDIGKYVEAILDLEKIEVMIDLEEEKEAILGLRGETEVIPLGIAKFVLLPFATFKLVNWLLSQCKKESDGLLLKSRLVSWLKLTDK